MAGRLKNAIKKRASRLFHGADTSEGSDSQSASNRNSLTESSRNSQPRHRKSLSLLSRSSKADRHTGPEASQAQPTVGAQNAGDFLAHPAIQPLKADPTPRTPRLERPRPSLEPEDATGWSGDETAEDASYRKSQRYSTEPKHSQDTTYQTVRPNQAENTDDLETRLSRLTVSPNESALPEIDIDPLTPFDLVEETNPTQARLSQLAIGEEGPEYAATRIKPLSQESDVNLQSNSSQEANIRQSLDAIHPRDAEFDRINEEVRACSNGEANFHLQNSLDFDRTVHNRDPVVHEHIRPHVHTIYEPKRTRSIHYHEHRTLIQPIKDPNPTILPEQHWLQDDKTGEIYRIPDELGKKLM
ncbi:hypothetical protein H9Q72_002775 [Fusarium xylarioides]|uniref:Uncharacterized protein n=1 Tax=Fusarium xylarioides TaxID=221167 RepID=A0A9P7I0C5_9HYPO|nr:hypothetical protein H9Q70_000231 [Fusarium xylarioides]KAG5770295.1 hypothetical protein H9Q72_002775 [Fusarium xylarioides]KAG5783553.1 hypothetical protein H9Q73_002799 [Fusarium xylarioides]